MMQGNGPTQEPDSRVVLEYLLAKPTSRLSSLEEPVVVAACANKHDDTGNYPEWLGVQIGQAVYPEHVPEKCWDLVAKYRAAIVAQLLTPAPTTREVTWKRATLKHGDHKYTDVKPERIECAIADDLAFLTAHPTRRSNSEAMAHRRELKDAVRQRIGDIAASRDLSDEEIKPVLKLKHHEITRFTESARCKSRMAT